MDLGPCAVSAIQIKPRSVRLIINRPAVSGYNVTSVGAKSVKRPRLVHLQ